MKTGRLGAAKAAEAAGAFCAVWTGARFVNSFFFHRSEYAALHREARILIGGPCVTDAGHISGALIDCQHARRIVNSGYYGGTLLYSAQHAARDVILETVRGATHELAFLVQLLLLMIACLFAVHTLVRRYAMHRAEKLREEWERNAKSRFRPAYGPPPRFSNAKCIGYQTAPVTYSLGAPSDDEEYDSDDGEGRFGPSNRIHTKFE